jgi:hypothetical protein
MAARSCDWFSELVALRNAGQHIQRRACVVEPVSYG